MMLCTAGCGNEAYGFTCGRIACVNKLYRIERPKLTERVIIDDPVRTLPKRVWTEKDPDAHIASLDEGRAWPGTE